MNFQFREIAVLMIKYNCLGGLQAQQPTVNNCFVPHGFVFQRWSDSVFIAIWSYPVFEIWYPIRILSW